MIGSAVLLPPLQARTVFGDGIASALYVSNYRFALQGVDYFAATAAVAVSALLVVGRRGAVLPGVAGHDHRHGVAHPACASAHRGPGHVSESPYLLVLALVAAVSFALSLVATYVVPPVAFFSLPTRAWQLAVGGLVALTAGQWRRLPPLAAAIAGWAGLAVILLACTQLSATTPYPGTAALLPVLGAALVIGAGCATPVAGMRPRPGIAADARDRPGVVLVVSVALAGAGARTAVAGPSARAGRQAGSGPGLRRAGRAHTALHREPPAIRRSLAPVSAAAVSRSAAPPPR